MKKISLILSTCFAFYFQPGLIAHCQMPCGIYHDDMVFDMIDQYIETMFKGMTMLTDSKFATPKEKNEFMRWVINKENMSDETAELILTYFLQQKIKPDEEDTPKRLASAHRLLFALVQIKQNSDRALLQGFYDEWEKFKLMFHVEGYECKIEMMKQKAREEKLKKAQSEHDHDHDHDHSDHDHTH